jgi:hypothetical protein
MLCLDIVAFSQADNPVLDDIAKKFQNYCKSYPREEVYVHTDRDIYIAGEEIWYTIFLFDRQTEKLTGESRIAYFEILNPDNRPVVQKRSGLGNGRGTGKAVLPDTLSPGIYTVRAYTNWMKNFMPTNCFTKKIKIFGDEEVSKFIMPLESAAVDKEKATGTPGISANFKANGKGIAEVEILSDSEFRLKNNSTCYIFLQTHGVVNYKSKVTLTSDITKAEIPGAAMIPGINQLTVFNSSGQPVSEIYSYTPRRKNGTGNLVVTSPNSCKPREQVQISIESPDSGFLSVSVVPKGTDNFFGIEDYMVFASEYGVLPDLFYHTGPDNLPDSILQNFLASARSTWIDWNKILDGHKPEIKYRRESQYHYLYGNIYNGAVGDSSETRFVFLSVPGKHAGFQYSVAGRDGSFEFCLPPDDNLRDLVIQPDNKGGKGKVIVNSSFSDRYPFYQGRNLTETVMPGMVRSMSLNTRIMKVYKSFEPREILKQEAPTSPSKRFYGKPDVELKMSDYIKLPTMQEVFFELLPGVSMRSENKGYQVSIKDQVQRTNHDDPMLMIDGVVIRDPAIIAAIDPELVEKIEVIKTIYVVGDYYIPGLVNLITTKGDLGNVTLPGDATRFMYRAYEPSSEFFFRDYSTNEYRDSHLPDFRNTLYWNSFAVQGNKQDLMFYSSDFLGEYEVVMQGVTSTGRLISQKKPMNIRK